MALIEKNLFGTFDKVSIAIDRIKCFEPPEGYYVAFSGGKDSVVILDLVKRSGVKFDAHYNITGIDPPELFYFIRDYHPEVQRHRPEMTIWSLIIKHLMPPTQLIRYCCAYLKERGGVGRRVITGVRRQESSRRKKRKMVEFCVNHPGKTFLHPIIDWSEKEVWQYIRQNNISYCKLYDEGFKRLGCIMCPMNNRREKESLRWPRYYQKYIRTFDVCIKKRIEEGRKSKVGWEKGDGEAMMEWWLRKKDKKQRHDRNVLFE